MSTSLLNGRAAQGSADGPAGPTRPARRPTGLLWLALRQSRSAIRVTAALLVLATVVLLAIHFVVQDRAGVMEQRGCLDSSFWGEQQCWPLIQRIDLAARAFTDLVQPAVFALPVVLGMFLGGPLLAQEYERGTIRLVLAQSVAPRRWLAARLAVAGLVVLPAVGVLSLLTTWVWWTDVIHGPAGFDPPFQTSTYPALGLAPFAWSLFGLALGVLVGELVRRTVTAVLVSGVLMVIASVVMRLVRPYLWPVVDAVVPYDESMGGFMQPTNAWLVERGIILPDGTRAPDGYCVASYECDEAVGAWGHYHPVSHFVPIQLVETGILVVLAVIALAVVFRRIARASG
ncbi:ABC transporter permease [Kitasatospora sp. NPDC058406]|uniref:ABC transporter permease n=1 Tax=Kitasatospora sp. NPDC058406 TaxID=3346483 RepID=UPI003652B281